MRYEAALIKASREEFVGTVTKPPNYAGFKSTRGALGRTKPKGAVSHNPGGYVVLFAPVRNSLNPEPAPQPSVAVSHFHLADILAQELARGYI